MSTKDELMATGMPWQQAVQIGQDRATGLTSTGTTKATALVLTAAVNVFTLASSGKGAILPPASGSPITAVFNGGANPVLVYASGTDVINANSAGGSFSVTNAKSATFIPSGNRWVANLSA